MNQTIVKHQPLLPIVMLLISGVETQQSVPLDTVFGDARRDAKAIWAVAGEHRDNLSIYWQGRTNKRTAKGSPFIRDG